MASTPPGAKVSIYDRNDKVMMMNDTPFIASLPVKRGYFKGQSYRLVFEMAGPIHWESMSLTSEGPDGIDGSSVL